MGEASVKWLVALIAAAVVGAVGYAVGLPAPVVYVLRGIARHLAYGGHGVIVLPCMGTIFLVTAPLGQGKSAFAVKKIVEGLDRGKYIVVNFNLHPEWAERMAAHGLFRRSKGKAYEERVRKYRSRLLKVDSLEELMRVRLQPPFKEGDCWVFLDEAHIWLNARKWNQGDRAPLLDWFALSRKFGFWIYLIAQRDKNLDVQVRELFEDHIILRNLKKTARILGIPVLFWFPFPVFVAMYVNHSFPKEVNRREVFRLGWWRSLYNTMETASFGEYGGELGDLTIWLPMTEAVHAPDDPDADGRERELASAAAAAPGSTPHDSLPHAEREVGETWTSPTDPSR